MQKRAVYLSYVWPEPTASAAGKRSENLVECLRNLEFDVAIWSHAQENTWKDHWQRKGYRTQSIVLNNDSFNHSIREYSPDLVVFDRFIMEEQFSWRVKDEVPNAIRIVDTQDLHFLRTFREEQVNSKKSSPSTLSFDPSQMGKKTSAKFLREIAALLRSDLNLIISKEELELLCGQLNFPEEKCFYYPLVEDCSKEVLPKEERQDFAFIGNFRHPPNLDACHTFFDLISENLSAAFPEHKLLLAGAYPAKEIHDLAKGSKNIEFIGPVDSAKEFLADKFALLAPLRFGAGQKGKIIDAWSVGTPVLTTCIGAEGLFPTQDWGGIINDDFSSWTDSIAELQIRWAQYSQNGRKLIQSELSPQHNFLRLKDRLSTLENGIQRSRDCDWLQALLWENQFRSTEFFSRWLALKEKKD